jgi:L-cystine transport system permease protein
MVTFEWKYVVEYFPKILQALPTTLMVVFVAASTGLVIGALLALARIERIPVLSQFGAALVSFIRGTPIFIQMFVVYYGLPMALLHVGINIMRAEKIIFVFITYGLNAGGFFSEIIRSAVLSVPREQWDAAMAIGHPKYQTYLRIIIPQSVVTAIPSMGVTMTGLFQDTSLTFAMGVVDVIGKARSLGIHTTHTLEGYFVAALIFVVFAALIERLFVFLEQATRTQRRFNNGNP